MTQLMATDPDLDGLRQWLADYPCVIGALVVGSSAAPYRDAFSDVDLEIVVADDAYAAGVGSGLRTPPGQFDVQVLPWTDFGAKAQSPCDIDHWPYERCVIVHDPAGRIAGEVERIVAMDNQQRSRRLHLHYFEFLFHARHVGRVAAIGDELGTRLAAGEACRALVRCLFVAAGRYPPVSHWTTPNLRRLMAGDGQLEAALRAVLARPGRTTVEPLIELAESHLTGSGTDTVWSRQELTVQVTGPDFRPTRERHGTL